jgi:ribosomal protein S21
MIIIKVEKSFESSLKKWKNKFEKIGLLKELKERKTFKKKSDVLREKRNKNKYKNELQQKIHL